MAAQQKFFVFVIAMCITGFSFAQNFEARYDSLQKANNGVGIMDLLKEWEAAQPDNADMLIAYYNYYAGRSRQEVVLLQSGADSAASYQLSDSTGNPVGTVGTEMKYDTALLNTGFGYIDKGIKLYPKRLDMRWGKVYMLGESKQYKAFTDEIILTIKYGKQMDYNWYWSGGAPLQDGKERFYDAVQDYINTLYQAAQDSLLPYMRAISEAVLQCEPHHTVSLADIALTYAITGNYDTALTYLLQAEQWSPDDAIVLNNIAEVYRKKHDYENAKAYYRKMIVYGNEGQRQYAEEKLKALQ